MKKGIMTVCCVLCLSLVLSARDITTKDGKVYKNVSISSVTPIGIDISYSVNGNYFIRLLRFSNLSKEIQTEFHYNADKASAYLTNLRKHSEMVRKKYKEQLKAKNAKDANHYAELSRVDAGRINVVLKVDVVKKDGVIGWADSIQQNLASSGHMGRIFVYGLMGVSGGEAARVIYPTGINMHGFPCYALTADLALILKSKTSK